MPNTAKANLVTLLSRWTNVPAERIPEIEAMLLAMGARRLRMKTIPTSEHWLVYHCRFRKRVNGMKRFARYLVELDRKLCADRAAENELRQSRGEESLSTLVPLPIEWPNEERRSRVGHLIEQFLQANSAIRFDLDLPLGQYPRDAACDRLRHLLEQLKHELSTDFEDVGTGEESGAFAKVA